MTLLTEHLPSTWSLDPTHSEVGFVVRHAGISKVKGRFNEVAATIDHTDSATTVEATINAASFDSGNPDRDAHIRSADFLDVENYPTLEFKGTVEGFGHEYKVVGTLTIHGHSQQVTLDASFGGVAVDPFGNTRVGVEATTIISRKDFGLTWNAALETGGVLVSDKVTIVLDLSFIKV